jgi:signal transduction histidine kinase
VQETNIDDLFLLEAQVTIFRLIQECLTNIGKHSQASRLTVSINKTHNSVSFIIQDNGRGFNPAKRRYQATDQGMGLAAMEERARMVGGLLSIWSQEGAGTRVAFDIPYLPKTE